MFSYCVQRLGMSEDEACRRIELARLARKFPLLFAELAGGRISLSVALLLKSVLTPDNHAELIAAARGASLRRAREMLAERFPSPDVPSRIRKLPERLVAPAMPAVVVGVGCTTPMASTDVAVAVSGMPVAAASVVSARVSTADGATGATGTTPASARTSSMQPPPSAEQDLGFTNPRQRIGRQRIEPLSAGRYHIQFTADASLKQKLELARDLLRHSLPNGDLAHVVSRALDLLLREQLQRRFGARRKDTPGPSARPAPREEPMAAPIATPQSAPLPATVAAAPSPAISPSVGQSSAATPQSSPPPVAVPAPAWPVAPPAATILPAVIQSAANPSAATPAPVTRAARREVLERDGLGCCWVGATGKRCDSTAWLEFDHEHPSGKGGGSEPENLRLLCRAHNRFEAERDYGREHVERAIEARQRSAKRLCHDGQQPSSSPAPA